MKRSSDKPRRRRFSDSERQEIITEYKTSNLSQASIALRHGISKATIQNWLRTHRKSQSKDGSQKLLPVRIIDEDFREASLTSGPAFEITLKSNRRLRVPSGFDLDEVRLLVQILEEPC
jgi:transposase-like protein